MAEMLPGSAMGPERVERVRNEAGRCWPRCPYGMAQSEHEPNLAAIKAPGTGQPGPSSLELEIRRLLGRRRLDPPDPK